MIKTRPSPTPKPKRYSRIQRTWLLRAQLTMPRISTVFWAPSTELKAFHWFITEDFLELVRRLTMIRGQTQRKRIQWVLLQFDRALRLWAWIDITKLSPSTSTSMTVPPLSRSVIKFPLSKRQAKATPCILKPKELSIYRNSASACRIWRSHRLNCLQIQVHSEPPKNSGSNSERWSRSWKCLTLWRPSRYFMAREIAHLREVGDTEF